MLRRSSFFFIGFTNIKPLSSTSPIPSPNFHLQDKLNYDPTLARPLVEHPPVMIPQLVRAVTKSPRWFAMSKAATKMTTGIIDDTFNEQIEKIQKKQDALAKEFGSKIEALTNNKKNKKSTKKKKSSLHEKQQIQQLQDQFEQEHAKYQRRIYELKKESLLMKKKTSATTTSTAIVPSPLTDEIAQEDLPYFNVLDCSFGGGCHTEAILEAGAPYSRVAAIDCDPGIVQRRVELVTKKYGKSRFRFFSNKSYRFSQIESLFGPRSFDAIIMDPGPNFSQLEDPTRGFTFHDPEDLGLLDLRYSTKMKSSAMEILNTAEETDLWICATELALLPNAMARHIVRSVLRCRPFTRGISEVLDAVSGAGLSIGDVDGDDLWYELSTKKFGRMNAISRFMYALRAMVNQEQLELNEGIRAAIECLEIDGRLIIFSRLPWEKSIIREYSETHPYLLPCFDVNITPEDAQLYNQPMETVMHVFQKTETPCFEIKNLRLLAADAVNSGRRQTDEFLVGTPDQRQKIKDDDMNHILGIDGLETRRGFPARSFASHPRPSYKEQRQVKKNANPPGIVALRDDTSKMPKF